MNTILLENIIEKIKNELCVAEKVYLSFERILVTSLNQFIQLETDANYLLINELIDINISDKVIIYSENNFVLFTKKSFELNQSFERFRRYLMIRTESTAFIPFTLDFIKIKPFNITRND